MWVWVRCWQVVFTGGVGSWVSIMRCGQVKSMTVVWTWPWRVVAHKCCGGAMSNARQVNSVSLWAGGAAMMGGEGEVVLL